MKNKAYIYLILLVLTCISCQSEKDGDKLFTDTNIVSVKTVKPIADTLAMPINSIGRLSSKQEVKLSFKTGGLINSIKADENQRVKEGQILAKLNLREIDAQVRQAQLALDKAERDYRRVKNLYNENVATLQQYENAKTALDFAKTNMEIAEFNLKHSVIKAPGDGVILKKVAEENEMIAPGFPVFLFSSGSQNWIVKASLTDKDIVNVQIGDSAKINFDAYPNVVFNGTVTSTAGMADPYTGTFEVEILLDCQSYNLITGFIAKVRIISGNKNAYYKIPVDAILEGSGKNVFFFKTIGDTAVKRIEAASERIIGDYIYLKDGLSGNENIVSVGALFLSENSRIKIDN